MTRLLAWKTALVAGVGLFSGVSAIVSFQIARLGARIVALITLERFHSWMGPNVFLKTGSMFAGVVTLCATETLFSRVCHDVIPEITSCFARVVALCAAKGIFPWVNPHVCFEVTSCVKGWRITELKRAQTWHIARIHISVRYLNNCKNKLTELTKWRARW